MSRGGGGHCINIFHHFRSRLGGGWGRDRILNNDLLCSDPLSAHIMYQDACRAEIFIFSGFERLLHVWSKIQVFGDSTYYIAESGENWSAAGTANPGNSLGSG